MYAGGILSFYFIWFNPIRMSFQLCFILKCKENTEAWSTRKWIGNGPCQKWVRNWRMLEPSPILHPSIGSNMVGSGDRHLMRNSHENQDPSTNVTSHSSSGMIQSVHMSSSFVILFWLLDSKHFSQAIDIPFSNFRSCQQEANYMLALENCKEVDSIMPMQLLVQVEL